MSDDNTNPDRCHCHHVVELKVKVSLAQWFIAILAVAMLGLFMSKLGELISLRLKDPPPAGHSGERLFPDRVEEP